MAGKKAANEPEPRPIIVKKIIADGHGGQKRGHPEGYAVYSGKPQAQEGQTGHHREFEGVRGQLAVQGRRRPRA